MRRTLGLMMSWLLALVACQPAKPSTTAPTSTVTAVPPTETLVPPTPTATSAPPTPSATPVPATETSLPPTPTATSPPPLTGGGGGRIVFSSRRGEGDYEVYAMNADGTDKRQLTRDTLESESPAWSPDGTRIVYTLDDYAGSSDIYVMDADGTNKRRLTRDGNAGSAAWSPDGKQIVFSHHVHGGGSDLYVMTVPDGAGTAGSHEVQLTQMGQKGALDPSWSPDGTHIVCVVDADPDPQSWELTLRVLNVQQALRSGGVSIAAMQALPRVGSSLNDRPAWSPTGSQIAFSAVVGGRRDIYVANADGTDLRQITETPDFDELDPAWSPDGTKIVFQANPDAQWDIYVMNADGSHRRRLTTDVANDTAPSWAP